jgi:mitochondrial ATPase complex subunit ATP10
MECAFLQVHAAGFTNPTNAQFDTHPLYQYIQINLQENILKSFLVNLYISSIRATVPTHRQPTYLVSSQNLEYVREAMGCLNSKIGYVYLVDEQVRIRWAGCADAMAEEAQALLSCTGVLLKRLAGKGAIPP